MISLLKYTPKAMSIRRQPRLRRRVDLPADATIRLSGAEVDGRQELRAARPIASRWSRSDLHGRSATDLTPLSLAPNARGTAGFIHFEKMSCPK
jgi:hypothetical protein